MLVGIDLGTTNSLIAYFTDKGPQIIPNRLGKPLTPSVVSVDEDGNVYVGETASVRMSLYPDTVVKTFKRSMGTEREYVLSGRKYKPEELSSLVLRALKEDAENFLGESVTEAVISVPAYFDDKRRKATIRAGELAGLKVERLISEPTAAAVAYGLYEKNDDTKFLVFDLGGGTFDVSIIELFDNILEVRAVAGDNYLGGEDFTQKLMELYLDKIGVSLQSLNMKEQIRIYKNCEAAKCEISEKHRVTITSRIGTEEKSADITENEFEKACEELLLKIRQPVKRSLSDAGLSLKDIDELVLIGGATKLDIVKRFLVKMFQKFPDNNINPDEAVALGAAVQAALKERNKFAEEIILTDVCSFTLGTEVVVEYADGFIEDGHYCPIIDRNTIIPTSRTQRLYTAYDNQEKVCIKVLQGESRHAKNNLYLGKIEVDVPKASKGKECIDVTYTYDINSILEVEVLVVSNGKKRKIIIKGSDNSMTDEEIERRLKELSYLKIKPQNEEKNRLALLMAEKMYEEALGEKRELIAQYTSEFEAVLRGGKSQDIENAREKLYRIFSSED